MPTSLNRRTALGALASLPTLAGGDFDLSAAEQADAAILALARLVDETDEAYGSASLRAANSVAEDEADLNAAFQAYDAALQALLASTPRTVEGVRAILMALAKDGGWERERTVNAMARLADCPALAGRAGA